MVEKNPPRNLSAIRLRSILHYDPETGVWTNLVSRAPNARAGAIAGTITKDGYHQIGIDGKFYRSHRLAVLYMTGDWPSLDPDHKDGNRLNNKWSNLRPATPTQNQANRQISKNNNSGHNGVYWNKAERKWQAQIQINRKRVYLGRFDDLDQAAAAYKRAAIAAFGEFANISGE